MDKFRIYVEPVARHAQRLFNIDINLPKEVEIIWEWDVRGAEDNTRVEGVSGRDAFTTPCLAHGFAESKAEAHRQAEQWADALSQKASYIYTPKGK